MKQEVFLKSDTTLELGKILNEIRPDSILLVTGKKSYRISGAQTAIQDVLKDYKFRTFSDFSENPKMNDLEKGIALFKEYSCDFVIAIGGGSVIDMGKLIAGLSASELDLTFSIKNNLNCKIQYPIIAIPTTGGTGSEATHFAVVYIDNEKYSYSNPNILPKYVIIDPKLSYSTNPILTAFTGADALCQAIESIWAVNSTSESIGYAKEALRIMWKNLPKAVSGYKSSKDKVMLGAFLAGKAINISKTTACHALSYKLTSLYNIPHGQAVALTLTEVMKINYYSNAKDKIDLILKEIGALNLHDGIFKIESFWKEIGLKTRLRNLNIAENNLSQLTEVNLERLKNNPVLLNAEQIKSVFDKIY